MLLLLKVGPQVLHVFVMFEFGVALDVNNAHLNVVTQKLVEYHCKGSLALVFGLHGCKQEVESFGVLDEKGFIVAKDVYFAEKLVEIKGISLLNPTVGETAVCTEEIRTSLLSVVYDMSGLAQFSDQVESVIVMNMNNSYLEESWRVVFSMNTGVKIVITKAFENGALKMQTALEKFESLDDYMKCYNYIVVSTIAETGKPQAVYTVDDEGIYGGEYA